MATQTLQTLDGIAKDDYTDLIIEQTNYKTYMLDEIERDSSKITFNGRRAVFSVESAPNLAQGGITDGGTLPVPGRESYDDGIVTIKYLAGGFEITDQAIKIIKGKGMQGGGNAFTRGMKALQKSFKKNANRIIWGNGDSRLATIATNANSATQTLDTIQYIQIGHTVDVVTISNGTVVSAELTVTNRNPTNKTIVLSASVNATTAEGIYLAGSYGTEMDGMRNITATSRTLHGIDSSVAANRYFNGNEVEAAGSGSTAIAGENKFIELANKVGSGGQDEIGRFITTRGVRDRLARQYQSQRRINDAKAVEIHGGYTAIMVNEIPVTFDDDCPKGFAFGLPSDMDVFTWHEVSPPDWLEGPDGTIWHLADSSVAGRKRTAWQAWFVWYAALSCTAPNRTGRIVRCQDDDPS